MLEGMGWKLTDLLGTYWNDLVTQEMMVAWVRVIVVDVVEVVKPWVYILKIEPAGFVDRLHVYEA